MTDARRDVVDVLTADHREVLGLIAQIRQSDNRVERRDLTDILIAELVRHSVAEEMYVYPAMRKHLPDGEQAVEHDVEEHKELEVLMKRLEDVDPIEDPFDDLIDSLEETLRDHIDDEEVEQFPQLREAVPADELVEMGEKVEKAKELAPTRPHPGAPHHELFHKTVGPGVGMIDRLRDKLTGRAA
jgi:hemerythrin-like domain-containing protein